MTGKSNMFFSTGQYMPKGIIRAEALRKQMRGDEDAEEYVNEILGNIEDEIHRARDRFENIAQVEVPVYFHIPYVDHVNAQRIVYFHTCKALEEAGYNPRIVLENANSPKPRSFFIVTWTSNRDIAEKKYMDDYLLSHTVKRTTVRETRKKHKHRKRE